MYQVRKAAKRGLSAVYSLQYISSVRTYTSSAVIDCEKLAYGRKKRMQLTVRFLNRNTQVEQEHWPMDLRRHRYIRPSRPGNRCHGLQRLRATPTTTTTTTTTTTYLLVRPAQCWVLRCSRPPRGRISLPVAAIPPKDGPCSSRRYPDLFLWVG